MNSRTSNSWATSPTRTSRGWSRSSDRRSGSAPHRIHYDADYCREVEGYPGLVVHAPPVATLLLLGHVEHTVAPGRFIRTFDFRAVRPTFAIGGFHLHADAPGDGVSTWSTNNVGEAGVEGRVTWPDGIEIRAARMRSAAQRTSCTKESA